MAAPLVGHHGSLLKEPMRETVSNPLDALVGVPFTKMTGSGNDFVVFDAREVPREIAERPEVIQAICNRNNGIGADGIVLLEPSHDISAGPSGAARSGGDIRLTYFNRDGTLGELCGNATLCSTNFAIEAGLASASEVRLSTDAGLVTSRLVGGAPEIDLAPVETVSSALAGIPLNDGESRVGYAVVGVPHVVILRDDLSTVDVIGSGQPIRQHATLQPAGANVNWIAQQADGLWSYRTYERGVEGETLACGTGAIAAAILLTEWGLAESPVRLVTRSKRELVVTLRSGESRNDATRRWWPSLRGEGRIVFRGQIERLG